MTATNLPPTETVLTTEDTKMKRSTRQLALSTLIVMVAFGIAKAISLGQTVIIAQVFGVGSEWDTYVTANRLPEQIFTLISGGALAYAFIPIFSGYLAKDDKAGAWRMASHVINTIFATTLIVSAVAFVAAPWLVQNVVAPGFDAAAVEQTVGLMRILLVSTLIFSVSGICMGILQSHNHFLLPALAPIMFDVGILLGVLFLLQPFGVTGIALGAVLGAAMHLCIQIPGLFHYRARWLPELGLSDPVLWQVIRLMLPRVAGLGAFQLNMLIMTNIGSRLGVGSVSALDWGWRLMQIPQTLVGTAMGIVIFPTLAALSALGDNTGKRNAMSGALKFILIASIPAAIGLILVGRPLLKLLERGAFDASASALVFATLQAFSLGIIVHSLLEIIARSFYADKDTLTPLWAALIGAAVNVVLAFALSDVARVESYGLLNSVGEQLPGLIFSGVQGNVGGVALANTIGTAVEVGILIWILRLRWHGINENQLAQTLLKTLAASLVMGLAVLAIEFVWTLIGFADRGLVFTVAQIGIQALGGALVFVAAAMLLRMNEVRDMLLMIFKRQRRAANS
jgi:putative peptidoglycan lipid II flippase